MDLEAAGTASVAATGGGPAAGATGGLNGTTVSLTRHDLMLDEDLPRALEAYFAVDEHRVMSITVPEGEELFRLMSIKRDPASLLRAKSTAEDDIAVAHLRHTGLSLELAVLANARDLIGALLPIPTHDGIGGRRRSLAATPGGGMSPMRRTSLVSQQRFPVQQPRRTSSSVAPAHCSNATIGGVGYRISFLCVMRLLFPSYPKKVVERVVMAALPPVPAVPPAPQVDHAIRLLFRSCRSSAGIADDSDNGFVTYDQLRVHCSGIDAAELEALVLRHSDLMRRYALSDLRTFEDLHVYDLIKRAGLPVSVLQSHRYAPPLSILNMMRCWGLLRPQLAAHLNGPQETRLSQLYVFLCQHGAPAAFRTEWPPIPSPQPSTSPSSRFTESAATLEDAPPPPAFNILTELGCGVDGFARPTCSVHTVKVSIEQLACIVYAPHHAKVVVDPVVCTHKATSPRAALAGGGSVLGPGVAATTATTSAAVHVQPNLLALAAPGLCIASSARDGAPAAGGAHAEQQSALRCVSGFVGLGSLDTDNEIFSALGQENEAPSRAAETFRDAVPQPLHDGVPTTPSPRRRVFPHQSRLRLLDKDKSRREVLDKVNAAFAVPFACVVKSLGASAYHDIRVPAASPRRTDVDGRCVRDDDDDVLVLTPRQRGTNPVRPLSAYQRECTPTLYNYSGLAPPPVPTRPSSGSRPQSAVAPERRRIGDRALTHAVSRPLGFTGVVLSAEMMQSPPSSPRFKRSNV